MLTTLAEEPVVCVPELLLVLEVQLNGADHGAADGEEGPGLGYSHVVQVGLLSIAFFKHLLVVDLLVMLHFVQKLVLVPTMDSLLYQPGPTLLCEEFGATIYIHILQMFITFADQAIMKRMFLLNQINLLCQRRVREVTKVKKKQEFLHYDVILWRQ